MDNDLVIVLVDVTNFKNISEMTDIFENIKTKTEHDVILVLNKIDKVKNEELLEISEKLNINQKTVNTYITRVMRKLEVNSKTDLYLLAKKHIKQPY